MSNNSCTVCDSGPARAQADRGQVQGGAEGRHPRQTGCLLQVPRTSWAGTGRTGEDNLLNIFILLLLCKICLSYLFFPQINCWNDDFNNGSQSKTFIYRFCDNFLILILVSEIKIEPVNLNYDWLLKSALYIKLTTTLMEKSSSSWVECADSRLWDVAACVNRVFS